MLVKITIWGIDNHYNVC